MDLLMQNLGLNSQDDLNTLKNEAEAWNILLQIALPLVLVLTFVAVYQILTYQKSYQELKAIISTDPPPAYTFQEKIMEIQFQKLLVAFEKVRLEEIERLNLFIFSDTTLIKRYRMQLQDKKFRNLCDESKEIFDDSLNRRQGYLDSLYSQILEKAQIEDDYNTLHVESCRKLDELIEAGDTVSAEPNIINRLNRCKIHQRIIDFVAGLEEKINTIQLDLVCTLFDEITSDIQGLPASTKELAVQLINEKSEERRRQYAILFHKGVTFWVKNQLSNDGYQFLNSSWRKIESI